MNPSRTFILRPIATSLLMLALLLSGLLAYKQLPLAALPQVDYPTIQVTTSYPGASPDVMASTVTAPLERQFGQMPNLTQMTSNSTSGVSSITLRFGLNLPLDVAEQQVQAAMNAANSLLPPDLPMPPTYNKVNPADAPILTLAIRSDSLSIPKLQDLVETRLAMKLSQLSGVGLVSIAGSQRPAMRIKVNSEQLAALGLSFDDIRTLIGNNNVTMSKGSFNGKQRASSIDTNDQLQSESDYRQLIVLYKNGNPVRLGDIATIIDDAENVRLAAWIDNQSAVLLNIQRQPGANVIAVTDAIKTLLPQLTANLPASVEVRITNDRTQSIRAAISEMKLDMLIAILLVVLVIYLFLRDAKATLIPALAIPLSLIGTCGVMYLLGFSINNLTLMALVIATGFVVDDAIVMIENIARHRDMGKNALQAALDGSSEIGFTIVSLTLSLVAVLIPLLFMQDMLGRLFNEFALTLASAILLSAIVSLTLTPMLSARFIQEQTHRNTSTPLKISPPSATLFVKEGKNATIPPFDKGGLGGILPRYQSALRWVLAHQKTTLTATLIILVATVALYIAIPKGFFPTQDTGSIMAIVDVPESTSFSDFSERQHRITHSLLENSNIDNITAFIGVDGNNATPNSGRLLIQLKPKEARNDSANQVIAQLTTIAENHPDIKLYLQSVQDLTVEDQVTRGQYQFKLSSPDSEALAQATQQLVEQLQHLQTLQGVSADTQPSGLQAFINIDRDAAARLGVSTKSIDQALYNAFGQRPISTIFTQSNQYRVVLETADNKQAGIAQLDNLYVSNNQGKQILLKSLATVDERQTPLAITRLDQFPSTSISFNLAPKTSLGDAINAITQAQIQLELPVHIETHWQGATLAFRASLSNTLFLMLAAIITVYIVLGVLYESFIHPITILSTLFPAAIGALIALDIAGLSLDMIGVIGLILLIGIVKKNAIMMIDFALDAMRNQGLAAQEAIFQACSLRLRPILMTTFAALFGALPLMLSTGLGAELRQPMGYALVGGLLLSQLLTLFTTPVIFLLFERLAGSKNQCTADKVSGVC